MHKVFLIGMLTFLLCLPVSLSAQMEDELDHLLQLQEQEQAREQAQEPEQLLEEDFGPAFSSANLNVGAEQLASPGKISLDIKGMDIIDVLKILAMRANLNIVASKNVRGRVTVFLKDVDPLDAMEIILAANDLAYEKKGDIINVMTERDYELLYGEKSYDKKDVKILQLEYAKAAEVGKHLGQIKTKIGKVIIDEGSNTLVLIDVPQSLAEMEEMVKNLDLETITKTFALNYAKATDMEARIKESLSKNIGEIKVDERTNRMVITDLPKKVDFIERMITDFDEKDKVVLIEAKIIQITLNKDLGYGINWDGVFAGIDTVTQSDLTINLSGVTPATTFTYTPVSRDNDDGEGAILRLLGQLGKTDVLSTPRITVANNQEAKVLVGTKEAFVTSTVTQSDGATTTADNVKFVDVGVSLSVVPTINEKGYVTMKIKPEVSSAPTSLELTNPDGSVRTSVPIVTTSEAETILAVRDGTTVILAGLMKDTRKDNTDKIPGLGDIPFLGYLFKSRAKEDEKTELVIFITPHIIREGEDLSEDAQEYILEHEQVGLKVEDKPTYRPYRPLNRLKSGRLSYGNRSGFPQDFQQYCSYVSEQINRTLQRTSPSEVKGKEVQLSFVLAADGYLKGRPKLSGSLDQRAKESIINSIERNSPFFPFPKDFHQVEETFKLTISFAAE